MANKNKVEGIVLLDFKTYYKGIVIIKYDTGIKGHIDQWDRTESLEINPHRDGELIFNMGATNVLQRKDDLFPKWCWKDWMSTCRRMNLDPYLSPSTKNQLTVKQGRKCDAKL